MASLSGFPTVAFNTHLGPLIFTLQSVVKLKWSYSFRMQSTLVNLIIIIIATVFSFFVVFSLDASTVPISSRTFNFLLEIECLILFFNAITFCRFYAIANPVLPQYLSANRFKAFVSHKKWIRTMVYRRFVSFRGTLHGPWNFIDTLSHIVLMSLLLLLLYLKFMAFYSIKCVHMWSLLICHGWVASNIAATKKRTETV